MTIHEIKNPLAVHTPHGSGKALFIFDYSIDINSVWFVVLDETGEGKHYFSEDLRFYGNPMSGENLIPKIPEGWKKSN